MDWEFPVGGTFVPSQLLIFQSVAMWIFPDAQRDCEWRGEVVLFF